MKAGRTMMAVMLLTGIAVLGSIPVVMAQEDWLECQQRANDTYERCVKQIGDKPIDRTRCENLKQQHLQSCKRTPVEECSGRNCGSR